MAQAWAEHLYPDLIQARSAGVQAMQDQPVTPRTVEVMAELGLDLRGRTATLVNRVSRDPWDRVISFRSEADRAADEALFPHADQFITVPVTDPYVSGSLEAYREAQDAIRAALESIFGG
jgi:protein-tyrosine-phosphatase